jgi:hypothetical protein
MADAWYELVKAREPITQGDLIFNCPLIGWQTDTLNLQAEAESEVLKGAIIATEADVVVMTQACDLEHNKVANVILCPHTSLTEYHQVWQMEMEKRNQNPTQRAWGSHCNDICDGFIWNLMMLNGCIIGDLSIGIRIVDFHEVFTVPYSFLGSLLEQRGHPRFRLLPPYREYLAQAFARFFMRVGLPVPIQKAW